MSEKSENLQNTALSFARDALSMLRFFTRLPIPALAFERDIHAMPDFTNSVRALPVAGAIIGLAGAAILLILSGLGLPPMVVAACTLCVMAIVTGAMHEDGLADIADGFGGGATLARKLEIMKDSRLGTYGVMALVLVSLARFAALTALIEAYGAPVAAAAVIAGAAVSRAVCVVPMWLLPPARADGAGFAAARPSNEAMNISAALAVVIAIVLLGFGPVGLKRVVAGLIFAALKSFGITEVARRQIGGQTGDVAGAAQQISELAFLIGLLLWSRL